MTAPPRIPTAAGRRIGKDAGAPPDLILRPIGIARTGLRSRIEAARQPAAAPDKPATIELYPGHHFEHALADLAGWEFIWVLFWFHLNQDWRPKVLPPRSRSGRKGVFATRSPHRPNPLGLSAVRLERVAGLILHVRDLDLLDGTPVLDIKPYVPYTDAHPEARGGWLDATAGTQASGAPADPLPAWPVRFSEPALAQADWIENRTGLPLRERISTTLALGPEPHPYRRIRRTGDRLELAVREWRVTCLVQGREVAVLAIRSGYRPGALASGTGVPPDQLAAHRAFSAAFGP